MNGKKRKGFSLIEMLVVMGIIAALIAASIGSYSAITRSAERAKCRELVCQVATAMAALYQQEGSWPRRLVTEGQVDGKLTADCARLLRDYYALNVDKETGQPIGHDRFGIVSPWAVAALRRAGKEADLTTHVSMSKQGVRTVDDHLLHFAVDVNGDGIIEGASVGGEAIDVRATVIVWCAGKDGDMQPYSRGLKEDDVYSWAPGQTKNVK